MSSFSLFDFVLDMLLFPRWNPWVIFAGFFLRLFNITDDQGNLLPRKRPLKARKGTIAYEWQLRQEEAEEWIRKDIHAYQEWLKFAPSLDLRDVIYTFAGLDDKVERVEGVAVLRGSTCVWRRYLVTPFDPDQIEFALRNRGR